MKKYYAFVLALVLGIFVWATINTKAAGAGDAKVPQEISKEEAVKKYPPPAGKKSYPEGVATTTSTGGFFQSPYSSRVYDCRKVKKGALILDDSANKVFVRP